jgi:hypothetical protein
VLFKRRKAHPPYSPDEGSAYIALVARFAAIQKVRVESVDAIIATANALAPDVQARFAPAMREVLDEIIAFDRAAAPWQRRESNKPIRELESSLQQQTSLWPAIEAHIDEHLARREEESLLAGSAWKDSGRVFTTTIGTALDGRNLNKLFHELADAAQVPRIRFHDLRHTCGTFLHAQGVDPFTIQEILGHSQLSTTRRYTHVNVAVQKAALAKVGELLQKPAAKRRLVRVK